jgi:hypothetical protein
MNIGAVLIGIALLVLVTAYVARPLFEKQGQGNKGPAAITTRRAQLIARRDAVYALIHELDADRQTGKVNDEDHRTQRERYVAEGVSLLQQLDALSSENGRAALETEIEAAVRTLRQTRQPASRATQPTNQPTHFCTQCGHPTTPGHNFCGHCGAPLERTA